MLAMEERRLRPQALPAPVPDPAPAPQESGPYPSGEFLRKTVVAAFCLLAAVYYLPLIGVTLSLNFPYWDVLGVPYYCFKPPYVFKSVVENLSYGLFADPLQYRPTYVLLCNLQYLWFGGELWAWYLVRWLTFFATAGLLFGFLRHVAGFAPAITAAAFFLFHQEPFVIDIMAPDGHAAFFAALLLYLLSRTCGRLTEFFDLASQTWLPRLLLVIVWTLASGSKEVMVPFLGALLVGFLAKLVRRPSVSALLLWLTLCVPVAFAAYRIVSANHPNVGPMLFKEGWSQPVRNHFYWSTTTLVPHALPHSPGHVLLYAGLAVVAAGFVASFWRRGSWTILGVLLLALSGCSFVILQAWPGVKYLPIPVLLLTCILGLCLGSVWEACKRVRPNLSARLLPGVNAAAAGLWVGGCLFYAACTISDMYSQYYGLMQSSYEMADIVNFMEHRLAQGYTCAVTGVPDNPKELPPEKGNHLKWYFERFGREFYDRPNRNQLRQLATEGPAPAGPFVLLTHLRPEHLAAGELRKLGIEDLSRLEDVFQFERSRYGFFGRLVRRFKRLETFIGNTHEAAITGQLPQPCDFGPGLPNPTHSLQWFPMQAGPHLLYVFGSDQRRCCQTDVTVKRLESFRRFGAFAR